MWHGIVGTPKQYAGSSGTVTIGAGEVVLLVIAHATGSPGSVTVLGGPAITVVAGAQPLVIQHYHTLFQANASANTIVFSGTDMYYVHTVKQGHA